MDFKDVKNGVIKLPPGTTKDFLVSIKANNVTKPVLIKLAKTARFWDTVCRPAVNSYLVRGLNGYTAKLWPVNKKVHNQYQSRKWFDEKQNKFHMWIEVSNSNQKPSQAPIKDGPPVKLKIWNWDIARKIFGGK